MGIFGAKPQKFYDIHELLKTQAHYYISMGGRSAGKSYSSYCFMLEKIVESNYKCQGIIIRRWEKDIVGKRASQIFDALVYKS